MPIKWTAEVDQVLLLKILETSNINADVKAISEAWPVEMEKPTPRAITERLVKIRTTAKNAGTSIHFSVSGKPATAAGTPRKRTAAGSANGAKKATPRKNGTKASSQTKRKRGRNSSNDDDSEGEGFKSEANNSNASDEEESPSKKTKTGRKAVVKLEDSGEDNDEIENGEEAMVFAY